MPLANLHLIPRNMSCVCAALQITRRGGRWQPSSTPSQTTLTKRTGASVGQSLTHATAEVSGPTLALLVFAAVVLLLLLTQCTARVPDTVGLSLSDARVKLAQAGLSAGVVSESAAGSGKTGLRQRAGPNPVP